MGHREEGKEIKVKKKINLSFFRDVTCSIPYRKPPMTPQKKVLDQANKLNQVEDQHTKVLVSVHIVAVHLCFNK